MKTIEVIQKYEPINQYLGVQEFVDDINNQQKYINRLLYLLDFIKWKIEIGHSTVSNSTKTPEL